MRITAKVLQVPAAISQGVVEAPVLPQVQIGVTCHHPSSRFVLRCPSSLRARKVSRSSSVSSFSLVAVFCSAGSASCSPPVSVRYFGTAWRISHQTPACTQASVDTWKPMVATQGAHALSVSIASCGLARRCGGEEESWQRNAGAAVSFDALAALCRGPYHPDGCEQGIWHSLCRPAWSPRNQAALIACAASGKPLSAISRL